MMMIPFVFMPFEMRALICSDGMSDPTATIEWGQTCLMKQRQRCSTAKYSGLCPKREQCVVSSATVPKTVSNAYLVAKIVSLLNACRHH